jgi:hypothetical protein
MWTGKGPKMARRISELTGEELEHLLGLLGASDSVELKLTIPQDARASAGRALGVDPLDAQLRQVFFFDTPDLVLNAAGVVVRARRRQGEQGDTVVKLRPVDPSELPDEIRRSPSFGVEVDAMPGGYVCSGSLKGVASNEAIATATRGDKPIRKLFSKEQRAFYAAHAPAGLELDGLSVLGPIPTLRLKWKPEGFKRRLVGEVWLYPDGSQIVELSTKALPSEAFQAAVESRAFLQARGIDLGGEQQTKTKTALRFFTGVAQGASKQRKEAAV